MSSDATGRAGDLSERGLLGLLGPFRRRLLVGVGLLLLTNGFDKAIPWLLQHAIDALRADALTQVRSFALGVLGCAAVMWLVRSLSRIQLFQVGRDIEHDLRGVLLSRIHELGPAFFRRMGTGQIMSRATSDLGQVRLLVGFGLLNVVNSVFAYATAITLMLTISPKLTLAALAPYPLIIVITRTFGRALFTRSRDQQQSLGRLADVAQEHLAGVRVVRAFGVEDAEARRFEEANQEAIDRSMRLVKLRGLMWPALMSVGSIGTLIVIWLGGSMVLDDELTVGQFAAFNAYLGQLLWPTLALGYLLSVVQRGRAAWGRICEVLAAEPEVQEAEDAESPEGPGRVAVEHLTYPPGHAVLEDVSFEVPAEATVAVVGPTGSGKSTLAALLPRLLPTPEGTVRLDGKDVTELAVRPLRRAVGYAQQEPFLFSTTIERNVAFGIDDPDRPGVRERAREAAQKAAIVDEVESLPDGWDTLVGERGVQLSGGQKQRIALARALLVSPRVLVLDDPLSSVDARTEARILEALDRAAEGRTMVLVTHRVAAARRAARVVVLEDGRVVEDGAPDELLERGGLYARIAARQRLERELEGL